MDGIVKHVIVAVMLLVFLGGLADGGEDPQPKVAPAEPKPPPWAKVAPEQMAEAKKHGVPVAFENDLGMRFVLIPAGTFVMGSPATEQGRRANEKLHRVSLTKPYYVQITEVTNAQFRKWKPKHDSGSYMKKTLDRDSQPAVQLSWNDAVSFAAWASRRDKARSYRLPTEAEWERACRAGTSTPYSWRGGATVGWKHANGIDARSWRFLGVLPTGWTKDDGHRVAAPVGKYLPSPWGLYDMHGNVAEWCRDWHGEYPKGEAEDPTGPKDGKRRVLRGGCWREGAASLRSASRWSFSPDVAMIDYFGFRLVSPLPE